MLREILLYYRSNKVENVVLFCQIVVFTVLLGTFIAFTEEAHYGKERIERAYKDMVVYQLIDGYSNPEDFEAFRAEPNSLSILKEYYNALNEASSFQFLSMFDQNIIIEDKEETIEIWKNDEQSKLLNPVNAFQINRKASEYFEIKVISGRFFQPNDFNENKNIFPVVLGNSYRDNFKVGDRISASFYQKSVELEVIGILEKNTFVYYNGDPEFYLDNYIVMPYIDYGNPQSEFDDWYQKIVYFAMINGYIFLESGETNIQDMKSELEAISEKTGFFNYSFVGSNPNLQKYRGLINIINRNYHLILCLVMTLFLINMIIIEFQIYIMHEKRLPSLAIHYLCGASLWDLIRQISTEIFNIFIFATLMGGIILSWLKIANFVIVMFMLLLAVLLSAVNSLISICKLKNAELMLVINREDYF